MKNFKLFCRLALTSIGFSAAVFSASVSAQTASIVMASTTSTEQSGLFAHLLPDFK